jgi:hypothetical protein
MKRQAGGGASMVFAILIALLSVTGAWKTASSDPGLDAYQFWVVGRELHAPGPASVYSESDRVRIGGRFLEEARRTGPAWLAGVAEQRKVLETYSSPFLYTLWGAFTTSDYAGDLVRYRLLLVACMVAGVLTFARLAELEWPLAIGAIALFAAWFMPFTSDLRVGNVNALQLGLLGVWLFVTERARWKRHDVAAGLLLGLAVTFKPNLVFVPAALGLHWLLGGRGRRLVEQAAGGLLGLLLAVAASSVAFGSMSCWAEWMGALRSMPGEIISVSLGNFAPSRLAAEILGIDAPLAFTAAAVLALVAAIGWASRRKGGAGKREERGDRIVVSLGCLLVVLAPSLAWLHYFVLTIPMILILAGGSAEAPGRGMGRAIFLSGAILALSIEPLMSVGLPVSARLAGALVAGASLVLFVAGLREYSRVRPLPDREAEGDRRVGAGGLRAGGLR